MAKKFGALGCEMSPAAQARAAQRAQRMLAEMPPQALEIYNRNRIREFDESEAELELMRRAAQAMLERGGAHARGGTRHWVCRRRVAALCASARVPRTSPA
jgi:hypothetical protein